MLDVCEAYLKYFSTWSFRDATRYFWTIVRVNGDQYL